MSYSTIPKAKKDGTIKFLDGTTPTAVELTVAYEEGNFTFETPLRDQVIIRDRGTISTVRQSDEQAITGSFNFYFRQFTDSSNAGSVQDFITGTGSYNANNSTGSGVSVFVEHFAVDLEFTVAGSSLGDAKDHVATFSQCVCTLSFAEGDPDAWTLNFTAYGGITYA